MLRVYKNNLYGKPQVGTQVNHSAGNCCCRSAIFPAGGGGFEQKSEVLSFFCSIVIFPAGMLLLFQSFAA